MNRHPWMLSLGFAAVALLFVSGSAEARQPERSPLSDRIEAVRAHSDSQEAWLDLLEAYGQMKDERGMRRCLRSLLKLQKEDPSSRWQADLFRIHRVIAGSGMKVLWGTARKPVTIHSFSAEYVAAYYDQF